MAYLKKGNIANGILTYRRKKTGQQLFIRWEKCIQEIINKYPVNETEFLLPVITERDKEYRKQMKIQCVLYGCLLLAQWRSKCF